MQEERTLLKVPDIAAGEGDANFVEFCGGHGAGGVVFFIALSDVTHVRDSGDWRVVRENAKNRANRAPTSKGFSEMIGVL